MNQHDEQHGHEPGDAPVDGAQAGPVEHEQREEQPDLAEHEAAVPSTTTTNGLREGGPDVAEHEAAVPSTTTTNGLREGGPDVAEHEAAVPSSVEDGSPEVPAQSMTEAAGAGSPGAGEQSATTIPPTGDDRVDEALSRLAELDRLDVTEHAGVVEDVHRALQDTLAEEEG